MSIQIVQPMNVSSVIVAKPTRIIDASKMRVERRGGKTVLASKSSKGTVDFSWLKAASEAYNISDDPRDYVLAEMPIVHVDVPNRNCDAFPYEEVSRFSTVLGCPVYKSFVGKPSHAEHDNKDPLKAKGVNFDAALVKTASPIGVDLWTIMVLSGFDRTKDRALANAIAKGERSAYSMGALVDETRCSICKGVTSNGRACQCIGARKGTIIQGRLKYDLCYGVNYIENSSVGIPANPDAVSVEWW